MLIQRISDILFFAAFQQWIFKTKTENIFTNAIGWSIGLCIAALIINSLRKDDEREEK